MRFKGEKDGGCIRSGLGGSSCLGCVDGRKGSSGKENSMSTAEGGGTGKNGFKFKDHEIQGLGIGEVAGRSGQ